MLLAIEVSDEQLEAAARVAGELRASIDRDGIPDAARRKYELACSVIDALVFDASGERASNAGIAVLRVIATGSPAPRDDLQIDAAGDLTLSTLKFPTYDELGAQLLAQVKATDPALWWASPDLGEPLMPVVWWCAWLMTWRLIGTAYYLDSHPSKGWTL
jgi:hypothetical protein